METVWSPPGQGPSPGLSAKPQPKLGGVGVPAVRTLDLLAPAMMSVGGSPGAGSGSCFFQPPVLLIMAGVGGSRMGAAGTPTRCAGWDWRLRLCIHLSAWARAGAGGEGSWKELQLLPMPGPLPPKLKQQLQPLLRIGRQLRGAADGGWGLGMETSTSRA